MNGLYLELKGYLGHQAQNPIPRRLQPAHLRKNRTSEFSIRDLIKPTLKVTCKMITGEQPYAEDSLFTIKRHEFEIDPAFTHAYQRGVRAAGADFNFRWRVHVALWAAKSATKLRGDFIECGVNKGFVSSAIMDYLNWDSTGKMFYLLDTFHGLDERYVSAEERADGFLQHNQDHLASGFYVSTVDEANRNFAEWRNAVIVQGTVPESLQTVRSPAIAFLHLDLNCYLPELAALEQLWERLVPGAFILHDDYGTSTYHLSKKAMDQFAALKNVQFATLPTGQGLLIKPSI
jgi:hypothetical protein